MMAMTDQSFNSQKLEICRICQIHYCVYRYVENRGPVEAAVKTGPV